jgi:adenosylcobinamide kinase/adenosylcobinamide-phosphate guanylyltransferase
MGIIPGDEATRRFRDLAGSINQRLAEKAHKVFLTVCGIPIQIK